MDRQNSTAIRNHIDTLWNDYSRSKNKLVLHFIEEWQNKYNLKLVEENERFS
jgi:hypothetical protein